MRHCILAKYREEVTPEQRAVLFEEIKANFAGLMDVDGITKVEVIPNCVNRPNRYDMVIRIEMTMEALDAYDHSEPHKIWKNEYMKYMEKKAIFDYEN